jgi:hypothetical protein
VLAFIVFLLALILIAFCLASPYALESVMVSSDILFYGGKLTLLLNMFFIDF